MRALFTLIFLGITSLHAQQLVRGSVSAAGEALPGAEVYVAQLQLGTITDASGNYSLELPEGVHLLQVRYTGYLPQSRWVTIEVGVQPNAQHFALVEDQTQLREVVVSGTMREVSKLESPVPVEVFSVKFFEKNASNNLFEGVQLINGVRPQLNCNVCNTGDIHINGLEGPYTMVLIDGMPIVSGLSTVYGLMGIPNAMIQQVEVVKGPASSLYGSEAVGGLINVITKSPKDAPLFSADLRLNSWTETNLDMGFKTSLGEKATVLTGFNVFNYQLPIDNNGDNFTDISLQERLSVFQKWNIGLGKSELKLAGRYFYEDRWGGEMQWTPEFRGGDSIYGESIITKRWELTGEYKLPSSEDLTLWMSYSDHDQDSYYGDMGYLARQRIGFTQMLWRRELERHFLLGGVTYRITAYDDNTPATEEVSLISLPGIFLQDEIQLNENNELLLGMRYDYSSDHGNIFTPRLAYKLAFDRFSVLRFNAGTGFRVVNLFTEEHAALTGAREVIITEELAPEQSYNANLNYSKSWYLDRALVSVDATAWYTYFTNQIVPDYDSDPNAIIYDNLDGSSTSRGLSLNLHTVLQSGWNARLGASFFDVFLLEPNESAQLEKTQPILTERWTGTWAIGYAFARSGVSLDYTGNLYGPMRLPLLGDLDPRAEYSPWWSIQNIQCTWSPKASAFEFYAGVKNLLNFTPARNSIARANDPFDRQVQFDAQGNPVPTANNPYALTFDPSYVYAPNQGRTFHLGMRYLLK